jgi:hypothetical protein
VGPAQEVAGRHSDAVSIAGWWHIATFWGLQEGTDTIQTFGTAVWVTLKKLILFLYKNLSRKNNSSYFLRL